MLLRFLIVTIYFISEKYTSDTDDRQDNLDIGHQTEMHHVHLKGSELNLHISKLRDKPHVRTRSATAATSVG